MAKAATKKLIYGVGINDADYSVNPIFNGKQVKCPFYSTWHKMLHRCYSGYYQKINPTYIGCSVSNDWLTFSNFKVWMNNQEWQGNALDKDILIQGNKKYSSSTCIFVKPSINGLFIKSVARRGKYPIGVSLNKRSGKYIAQCHVKGSASHIGYYESVHEAHEAYKEVKYKLIAKIANQQSEPLRTALLNYVIEG
jgi:hypothetical protein